MAQINPTLPSDGGDNGTWGEELNAALTTIISQGNASDSALAGKVDVPGSGTASSSTFLRGDGTWATPPAGSSAPAATTAAPGLVQLTGDLGGTATAPTLAALSPSPAGTFGSASSVPTVTVDGKGRVTAVTETPIGGFYFYTGTGWPDYPTGVPCVFYSVGYTGVTGPANAADNSVWFK